MSDTVVKLLKLLMAVLNGDKSVEDARAEALELGLQVDEKDTDAELQRYLETEEKLLR